jgi:hypothetical protein
MTDTYASRSGNVITLAELRRILTLKQDMRTHDQSVAAFNAATRGLAALLEPAHVAALVAIAKAQTKVKAKKDELGRWAAWWCTMPLPDPTVQSQ